MELIRSAEVKKTVYKLGLTLTPAQKIIDASPARFKIVRAGRKFGKTTYAQKKALDWLRIENSVHWHIAPTYTHAKLISWEEFKALIPKDALGKKPNDSDLMIVLKNGSRLHLMGSDNPDSLRGPAPSSFTFEEAAFQKGNVWSEIMRPNIMPKKAPGLFISTPKGYNWFYDLEEEAKASIAKGETEWANFHYSVYDNPHLDPQEIAKAKASCANPAVWNQEYMALYESSAGRVFASLDVNKHTASLSVPHGTVYRSVDWGMRDDCAALWANVQVLNNKKTLCVYREYLENNLSAPQQANIIRSITTPQEKVASTAISHDAAKQDPAMQGLTVLWHFNNAGIGSLRPSSRDKKNSRQMVNDLIRQDRLIIDKDTCPKLWKQLMSYEWKDTAMEKTEDGNDDAVDSLHYLVEMLQIELFMERTTNYEKTNEEIWETIRADKAQQKIRKFPIESKEALTEFKFDGLSAGYFE